jgi:glutamate dehydrogenase/leucine dehydrogenase
VAIQGFGSVGKAAGRFFSAKGAIIVAVADSSGAVHNSDGIDVEELTTVKQETGRVINYGKGSRITREELFGVECDILIPAATADVIHEGNVAAIKARLILEGANIPSTMLAEEQLYARGILVVPDFIANAGGVIMAAMEYAGKTELEAFAAISERIRKNTRQILEKASSERILPRAAADDLARQRLRKAMAYREY